MKYLAHLYDSDGKEQFTFDVAYGFRTKRFLTVNLPNQPVVGRHFTVRHRNGRDETYEITHVECGHNRCVAQASALALVFEDA